MPIEVKLVQPVHWDLGRLRSLELGKISRFSARRFYWISDVPPLAKRGRHAHKSLRQLLFMVAGECTLDLKTPNWSKSFRLRVDSNAVYCPPGFWREISEFSTGAILGVLASQEYDEGDYIRSWQEFVTWSESQSETN